MTSLRDITIIVLLFFSFAALHSFFAAFSPKEYIREKRPALLPYYRLLYNIFSVLHLTLVFILMPEIDILVYELTPPYDIAILFPQYLSLIGFIYCLRYFNNSEFLGIRQALNGLRGIYDYSSLDEKPQFRTDGPFRFIRHPLYFFSIIFLGSRPYMFLDYFIAFLCMTVYFLVGARFEEQRLIKIFGDDYIRYRNKVPFIIPFIK